MHMHVAVCNVCNVDVGQVIKSIDTAVIKLALTRTKSYGPSEPK